MYCFSFNVNSCAQFIFTKNQQILHAKSNCTKFSIKITIDDACYNNQISISIKFIQERMT